MVLIVPIGFLYLHGNEPHDPVQAKRWLREAAEQAHGEAAYELGCLAVQEDDDQTAHDRFNQGDSLGHAGCKRELALLLERENRDNLKWDGSETKDLLEDAEHLGDVEATVQLGVFHEKGLGNGPHRSIAPRQLESALLCYVRAARKHHVRAMLYAAETYHLIKRYDDAAAWFTRANHPLSRIMLAIYRLHGHGGVTVDTARGFDELKGLVEEKVDKEDDEMAIRLGKARGRALFEIGHCYEDGRGCDAHLPTAEAWYKRSALETRNTEAMIRLAWLAKDERTALDWYRRAAEEEHREAQYQVGLAHRDGLAGLDLNPAAACRYLTKAANQNHPRAMYELAKTLWDVQHEYKEALRWYEKAAALKVTDALFDLGTLYHEGFSSSNSGGEICIVIQDYRRAFGYFMQAAELGHEQSSLIIGTYFYEGYLPDLMDRQKALTWYETAYDRCNKSPLVELALGQLKHTLANEQPPSAAGILHEEAYGWFVKAAQGTPGVQTLDAKTMVAMYHLLGWAPAQQDTVRGFQELLSIAKEGVVEVFEQVAKCYEGGIGVEKDSAKALGYWMDLAASGDQNALERVKAYYDMGIATADELDSARQSYALVTESSSHGEQGDTSQTSSSSSSLYD